MTVIPLLFITKILNSEPKENLILTKDGFLFLQVLHSPKLSVESTLRCGFVWTNQCSGAI